jgi:hypothetical protein
MIDDRDWLIARIRSYRDLLDLALWDIDKLRQLNEDFLREVLALLEQRQFAQARALILWRLPRVRT